MLERIDIEVLTRVEGEGGVHIEFDQGRAKSIQLRLFESPRLFEAILRGRAAREAPDITARLCGICPVAHQLTACRALEAAFGIAVPPASRRLRRLLYTGEWIASHALQVFLLHAPGLLGFRDVFEMSQRHPELVTDALHLKKVGNRLMRVIGGREIHPVNLRLGGFFRAPVWSKLEALVPDLELALEAMGRHTRTLGRLGHVVVERDPVFVAMRHPEDYPITEGRIVSSRGLDISASEFERHFVEHQVDHSNALHCTLDGRGYTCGPLARVNLNFDRLGPAALAAAEDIGFSVPATNPFASLTARCLELLQCLEEALAVIEAGPEPFAAPPDCSPRPGSGSACTEAPRGLLYHRYDVDTEGLLSSAAIVPPTAQNQGAIEADLWALAPQLVELDLEAATSLAEQAVRNYDPCISCATHLVTIAGWSRSGEISGASPLPRR